MSHTFRQVDRETLYLLPPTLDDWLPDGHLARFVVEMVAQLDLTSIKAAYAGLGSKAHHPEMLLALLFYGYATSVFSSRKLERATNQCRVDGTVADGCRWARTTQKGRTHGAGNYGSAAVQGAARHHPQPDPEHREFLKNLGVHWEGKTKSWFLTA